MKIRVLLTYGALYLGLLALLIALFYFILNYPNWLDGFFIFCFGWGIIFFPAGLIDWYNYFYKPKKKSENEREKMLSQTNEALKILKSRYAKGEITKEEFEEMKKDLKD